MATERTHTHTLPTPPELITDLSMQGIGTHAAYWEFFSASFGKSPDLLSRVSSGLKSINIH